MGFFNKINMETATDKQKLNYLLNELKENNVLICEHCLQVTKKDLLVTKSACCIQHLKIIVDKEYNKAMKTNGFKTEIIEKQTESLVEQIKETDKVL